MLTEFGFQKLDEVGDVPWDGHVAGHGKFRAGEEGFDLAEEVSVRLRFEQGDKVAEEGDARRGAERSSARKNHACCGTRRFTSLCQSARPRTPRLLRNARHFLGT